MKNKRVTERFGIREGDRVRLRIRGDMRNEETDAGGFREICGYVYQIYRDFVVVMTRVGTHPAFLWQDFQKYRVE